MTDYKNINSRDFNYSRVKRLADFDDEMYLNLIQDRLFFRLNKEYTDILYNMYFHYINGVYDDDRQWDDRPYNHFKTDICGVGADYTNFEYPNPKKLVDEDILLNCRIVDKKISNKKFEKLKGIFDKYIKIEKGCGYIPYILLDIRGEQDNCGFDFIEGINDNVDRSRDYELEYFLVRRLNK